MEFPRGLIYSLLRPFQTMDLEQTLLSLMQLIGALAGMLISFPLAWEEIRALEQDFLLLIS